MRSSIYSKVANAIDSSPTAYHAAHTCAQIFTDKGFIPVDISDELPVNPGPYFTVVGGALFAWIRPREHKAFHIVGAHTDSPGFRVRPNHQLSSPLGKQIALEIYGAPLRNSWLDRDLGLAGRVYTKDSPVVGHLVNVSEPVMKIPQLAIHLDRNVNTKGLQLNPQTDLNPMWFGDGPLLDVVASQLGQDKSEILSFDLAPYDLQPHQLMGPTGNQVVSVARIDNLVSVFAATEALANLDPGTRTPVAVFYDHEEVGSVSQTGAAATLLADLLERISSSFGASRQEHLRIMASSKAISADGAHATHASHKDKHDVGHPIVLNQGVAIKRNASQRYATQASSAAELMALMNSAELSYQQYSHPNHIPCGSTIGPVMSAQLGVATVDLGVAQLAMHSVRETAGCSDIDDLGHLLDLFWQ